jgi:hypothetical protein
MMSDDSSLLTTHEATVRYREEGEREHTRRYEMSYNNHITSTFFEFVALDTIVPQDWARIGQRMREWDHQSLLNTQSVTTRSDYLLVSYHNPQCKPIKPSRSQCALQSDKIDDTDSLQSDSNKTRLHKRPLGITIKKLQSRMDSQQPLLSSSFKNGQRRHYKSEIELSSRQSYRPPGASIPTVTGTEVHEARTFVLPLSSHQEPVILNQANPAEDLSIGLCSHGFCCIQCVRTQEIGIVQNCGAFEEIVGPGLYCGSSPCSCIVGRLSLRVQQLDVTVQSKSKDDGT